MAKTLSGLATEHVAQYAVYDKIRGHNRRRTHQSLSAYKEDTGATASSDDGYRGPRATATVVYNLPPCYERHHLGEMLAGLATVEQAEPRQPRFCGLVPGRPRGRSPAS